MFLEKKALLKGKKNTMLVLTNELIKVKLPHHERFGKLTFQALAHQRIIPSLWQRSNARVAQLVSARPWCINYHLDPEFDPRISHPCFDFFPFSLSNSVFKYP